MQDIEKRLKPLPSTSFEYLEPEDLSNKATRLRMKWDANVLKITGTELAAKLDAGTPRILIEGGTGRRPDQMESSVTIMPYMMDPGEDHIIAEAIHAALTNPGPYPDPVVPRAARCDRRRLDGQRPVSARRGRTAIHHRDQDGDAVYRRAQGRESTTATLRGAVRGDQVELRSVMEVPGNPIHWTSTARFRAMPCRATRTWANMVPPAGRRSRA